MNAPRRGGAPRVPAMTSVEPPPTSTTAASWRTQRPVLDVAKCVGCMACWKFCPEPAIRPEGSKVAISLGLCKGCGICAAECPVDAIRMDPEVA